MLTTNRSPPQWSIWEVVNTQRFQIPKQSSYIHCEVVNFEGFEYSNWACWLVTQGAILHTYSKAYCITNAFFNPDSPTDSLYTGDIIRFTGTCYHITIFYWTRVHFLSVSMWFLQLLSSEVRKTLQDLLRTKLTIGSIFVLRFATSFVGYATTTLVGVCSWTLTFRSWTGRRGDHAGMWMNRL